MPRFDAKFWKDCGNYWLHIAPQGTPEWLRERAKCLLTASKFGEVLGVNFEKPIAEDDTLRSNGACIVNISKEQALTDERMLHGILTEPKARKWYESVQKVKVEEVGIATPKWDTRIGASVDGMLDNGIIEIKCPLRMYYPLLDYLDKKEAGWNEPPFYHEHIWLSHYCQMQGGMAVTGKEWCDYIVYCVPEGKVFAQRIFYNQKFWENILYPKICEKLAAYPRDVTIDS